jgi:hypothetical protein
MYINPIIKEGEEREEKIERYSEEILLKEC